MHLPQLNNVLSWSAHFLYAFLFISTPCAGSLTKPLSAAPSTPAFNTILAFREWLSHVYCVALFLLLAKLVIDLKKKKSHCLPLHYDVYYLSAVERTEVLNLEQVIRLHQWFKRTCQENQRAFVLCGISCSQGIFYFPVKLEGTSSGVELPLEHVVACFFLIIKGPLFFFLLL